MQATPLHLGPGSDLRRRLEQLAHEQQAQGFVLSIVGNLSQAIFACPGRSAPTVLSGELEIISLQGTLAPQGVHLHLSLSDSDCQVWGGHLEHGSVVLKGADLLVALLPPAAAAGGSSLQIAVAEGCPWSRRALRMLHSLGIAYELVPAQPGHSLPQIYRDGVLVGGYSALADLHASGELKQWSRG